MVHFIAAAALILLQNLLSLSKTLDPHFKFLNEFIASVIWNVWSLESFLVFCTWSQQFGLLTLGLRLLLGPLLLRQAYVNPCGLLFTYLSSQPGNKKGRELFLHFCAELLAIPASLAFSMAIWNFLDELGLSDDHTNFLQEKVKFFLSVPPFTGFTIEIFVTFLMFMPGTFAFPSTLLRIAETFLIVFLVFQFGSCTGAFMNPMVALTYLLMWHYGDTHPSTLVIHLFVFWVGPLVGTVMALGMARFLSNKVHVKLL